MSNNTINQKTTAIKSSISIIVSSIANRIFSAVFAFAMMYLLITKFSDKVNAVTRSAMQLTAFLAVIDGGIGTAIVFKLYKPLFNKDWDTVNQILSYTHKVFKKIGYGYVLFLLLSAIIFPLMLHNTPFSLLYIMSLVLITGTNKIFNYFIFAKYFMILESDQKYYVINIFNLIFNVSFSALAIIPFFTLPHTIWYSLIPVSIIAIGGFTGYLLITIFVKFKYPKLQIVPTNLKLGKIFSNAFIHKICFFLITYLDILVLNFASFKFGSAILISISVYGAFLAISATIRMLFEDVIYSVSSPIGQNLNIKKKISGLFVNYYEYFTILIISFIFICYTLISPFIINAFFGQNYPSQYFNIGIAILLSLTTGLYLLRIPYWTLITSYGLFRETRSQAFVEAFLNISLSLILVWFLKVEGVLIATAISSLYRFLAIRHYCLKNIINEKYSQWSFIKSFIIFIITMLITFLILWLFINNFKTLHVSIINLLQVGSYTLLISLPIIIGLSLIFKYQYLLFVLSHFKFLRKYKYFQNIYNKFKISLH